MDLYGISSPARTHEDFQRLEALRAVPLPPPPPPHLFGDAFTEGLNLLVLGERAGRGCEGGWGGEGEGGGGGEEGGGRGGEGKGGLIKSSALVPRSPKP